MGASAGVGCTATLLAPNAGVGLAKAAEIDKPALRIGLMTYRLGQDWDVDTIIKNCQEAQWEHVELRTTHGHGVEIGRTKAQRRDVRKKFEDAGIKLSLGKMLCVYGINYRPRMRIGRVDGPQPVPKACDYDLWCGPAPTKPLMRQHLHYDWHWDWNTGNGDLGNMGLALGWQSLRMDLLTDGLTLPVSGEKSTCPPREEQPS